MGIEWNTAFSIAHSRMHAQRERDKHAHACTHTPIDTVAHKITNPSGGYPTPSMQPSFRKQHHLTSNTYFLVLRGRMNNLWPVG